MHQSLYIAAYISLRWSEIATLRPDDVALEVRSVRIRAEESKNGRERSVGYPRFMHDRFWALTLKRHPAGRLIPDLAEPTDQESWFLTVRRKAELSEGFMFHDLRHSAASFAVSVGALVKVVQKMLGHSPAAMTLNVYSDLFDTDVDDVFERIGGHLEEALKPRDSDGHQADNGRG